jgi:hypothetical protein
MHPQVQKKPLLSTDLRYWIVKLILADESELTTNRIGEQPPANSILNVAVVADVARTGDYFMALSLGLAAQLRAAKSPVGRICYQIKHAPTGMLSPIFDHGFRTSPENFVADTVLLGPMQLRPGEFVARTLPERLLRRTAAISHLIPMPDDTDPEPKCRMIFLEIQGEDESALERVAAELELIVTAAAEAYRMPEGIEFIGTSIEDPDDPSEEDEGPVGPEI